MNKRDDARKLKPAAQHLLRRQVVNAVRDGMKQVEAANFFGASLRAVNKWVALDKLGGLRALKAKRRGRRTGEGALKEQQAARIYQLILGKMPDQLKLPFYLWTRAAVAQLIEREFAIAVSLSTVGRYLKAWGLSAQRPVSSSSACAERGAEPMPVELSGSSIRFGQNPLLMDFHTSSAFRISAPV
jgi:transposase